MNNYSDNIKELESSLGANESVLVGILPTSKEKIQLEISEFIPSLVANNGNDLLYELNKSDERFNRARVTRGWIVAEVDDAIRLFPEYADEINSVYDNREEIEIGLKNPQVNGKTLHLHVKEATTPFSTWDAENIERSAKRAGADGDYLTHDGSLIFRQVTVVSDIKEPVLIPYNGKVADAFDASFSLAHEGEDEKVVKASKEGAEITS